MLSEKSVIKTVLYALGVMLIIIIGVIVISLNRGFDYTDEGFSLLSYKYADIYRGGIFNFHIIINKLTAWLNPTILTYRKITLFLTLLSSLALSVGFYKWVCKRYASWDVNKSFVLIFCFISVGNFLTYVAGNPIVSYNTIINFTLQVCTGCVLYLLSFEASELFKAKLNTFILLTIGFLCGFAFFVKFSTSVLLFFTYLMVLLLYTKKQPLKTITGVALVLIGGYLAGLFTYFIFFEGYAEWLISFKTEFTLSTEHAPELLLLNYLKDVLILVKFMLKYFSWLIIIPAFILFDKRMSGKRNPALIFLFSTFAALLFIYETYHFEFYRTVFATKAWNASYIYIIIIALQTIILAAYSWNQNIFAVSTISLNKALVISLLVVLPVIGAVGTANLLFLNVLVHLAPWFCIMWILLNEIHIKSGEHNNWFSKLCYLFIVFPALMATTQIVDGNIFYPYYGGWSYISKRANFFNQTEKIEDLPLLNGLYIDKKSKDFLLKLNKIFRDNKFRATYPVVAFNLPGVVYALNGTSPGMPWLTNTPVRGCKSIERFTYQNNPPVMITSSYFPLTNELLDCMKTEGFVFPDRYAFKGEAVSPNGDSLKIYFPK